MGPKNKQGQHRQQQLPAAAEEAANKTDAWIRDEFKRALDAIRRGNHPKARKITKDLLKKHGNSALAHRAHASVLIKLATYFDSDSIIRKHLQDAVDSAERATKLSPDSIEFARFYASLLYENPGDQQGYNYVVQECQRAFSIANPINPAKDRLTEEPNSNADPTDSIAEIRKELQSLAKKASAVAISDDPKPPDPKETLKNLNAAEMGTEKEGQKTPEEVLQQNLLDEAPVMESSSSTPSRWYNLLQKKRQYLEVKKIGDTSKTIVKVRNYWDTRSVKNKKRLLELKISDLKEHCRSSEEGFEIGIFEEAVAFAERCRTWVSWACFLDKCDNKFGEQSLLLQHYKEVHVPDLKIMRTELRTDLVDSHALKNCELKPLDTAAVARMIKNQPQEAGEEAENAEEVSVDGRNWPSMNDPERQLLLRTIQGRLQNLYQDNCLAGKHLEVVRNEALTELREHIPEHRLQAYGLLKIPACLLLLGAESLKQILAFVEELISSCFVDSLDRQACNIPTNNQESIIKERFVFTNDLSSLALLLDACLTNGDLRDDLLVSAFVQDSYEDHMVLDGGFFITWLYDGITTFGEEMASWKQQRACSEAWGIEVEKILTDKLAVLNNLAGMKLSHLKYRRAIISLENILNEELQKSQETRQRLESVLRNRQEEIIDSISNGKTSKISDPELEVIRNVLTEAQSQNVDQPMLDDACVRAALSKLKRQVCKLEARILRSAAKIKDENITFLSWDYRSFLLPLLKSFSRARLEKLMAQEANEKVEAASEELFAEPDNEKNKSRGKPERQMQEKPKGKKKNKSNKTAKHLEVTGTSVQLQDHEDNAENRDCPTVECLSSKEIKQDEEPGPQMVSENLENLEEYVDHQWGVDGETREILHEQKLEAQLEKLRKFENDFKQRALAIQSKKNDEALLDAIDRSLTASAINTSAVDMVTETSSSAPRDLPEEQDHLLPVEVIAENMDDEYRCFVSVTIQALWHITRFRNELLQRPTSEHEHIGDPCAVCALRDIFTTLGISEKDMLREAAASTSLSVALRNFYPDSGVFCMAKMNDAPQFLVLLFDSLHDSAAEAPKISRTTWVCTSNACLAHSIFGMQIFEVLKCAACDLWSRMRNYTSLSYDVSATILREQKIYHKGITFAQLLKLAESSNQRDCNPLAAGCGAFGHLSHNFSGPPQVFTIVLEWQANNESKTEILDTLRALSDEVDISVPYEGLDPGNRHGLVSVVCYHQQQYYCFGYSHEAREWLFYDGKSVAVIGSWGNVFHECGRRCLQPQVLFFEAVQQTSPP